MKTQGRAVKDTTDSARSSLTARPPGLDRLAASNGLKPGQSNHRLLNTKAAMNQGFIIYTDAGQIHYTLSDSFLDEPKNPRDWDFEGSRAELENELRRDAKEWQVQRFHVRENEPDFFSIWRL